ncbi:hypothetical protein EX30DRAFT_109342 [Ascodesmis nigricans]|uniref:Uncharacterized protein n=1 Tax=Ascodesmis nigricans TaxID=341454 RepID=A0A4S2MSW4_9PEZI|nr:hypothetical protein EX30DRAFT_109342 [Ascodesmis nigricans]
MPTFISHALSLLSSSRQSILHSTGIPSRPSPTGNSAGPACQSAALSSHITWCDVAPPSIPPTQILLPAACAPHNLESVIHTPQAATRKTSRT